MSSAFIVFSPIEMIPELTTTLTKSNTGRAAKFRHPWELIVIGKNEGRKMNCN
jgi:hypothetical protein